MKCFKKNTVWLKLHIQISIFASIFITWQQNEKKSDHKWRHRSGLVVCCRRNSFLLWACGKKKRDTRSQEGAEGFFVRECRSATSLCTGSAEVNSRVWQVCTANAQRSLHCVFSLQLELFFKLTLVVWGIFIPIPDEGHGLAVSYLLVPEHYNQVGIIMAAVNVDFTALLNCLGGRLPNCNSAHLTCGRSRFRETLLTQQTRRYSMYIISLTGYFYCILNLFKW